MQICSKIKSPPKNAQVRVCVPHLPLNGLTPNPSAEWAAVAYSTVSETRHRNAPELRHGRPADPCARRFFFGGSPGGQEAVGGPGPLASTGRGRLLGGRASSCTLVAAEGIRHAKVDGSQTRDRPGQLELQGARLTYHVSRITHRVSRITHITHPI